jgi:hypothetical protein
MPKKVSKNKKARHTPPRQQIEEKPFPFMELPPELRDMIYEMALTDVNGISIVSKSKAYRRTVCRAPIYDSEWTGYSRRRNHTYGTKRPILDDGREELAPQERSLVPNILAVSKQIYKEAIGILYGQDFVIEDTDALHRFLAIIGLRNQQRLLSLDVNSFCEGRNKKIINHCAFMSLAGATNLKSLRLNNARFRYYGDAKGFARGFYCNAHYFLEAYGAAHGRRDAALDVLELDDEIFDYFNPYRRNVDLTARKPTGEELVQENKRMFRAELCRLLGVK